MYMTRPSSGWADCRINVSVMLLISDYDLDDIKCICCDIMADNLCFSSAAVNDMEKKLAEYKCDTNEAICLKLGKPSVEHNIPRINSSVQNAWLKKRTVGFCLALSLLVKGIVCLVWVPCLYVKVFVFDAVRFPEDIDDESTTFHPEYSHQLFGDEYVYHPPSTLSAY